MTLNQFALFALFNTTDLIRFWLERWEEKGEYSTAILQPSGEIPISRAEFVEMIEEGWLEVDPQNRLHPTNEGMVMFGETWNKFGKAMNLLERAATRFENDAPDKDWHRDFYLLTGEHAVLTDEGWSAGADKSALLESGYQILDEVNAPS